MRCPDLPQLHFVTNDGRNHPQPIPQQMLRLSFKVDYCKVPCAWAKKKQRAERFGTEAMLASVDPEFEAKKAARAARFKEGGL